VATKPGLVRLVWFVRVLSVFIVLYLIFLCFSLFWLSVLVQLIAWADSSLK